MLRSVLLKMLHDLWRATLIWTGLSALLAAFYLSLYPSIGAVEEMRQLLDAMPPELRAMFAPAGADLGTPAGYLNVELFSFVLPLLVAAITLTIGGGATAGEEERGTLELLLANPIRRWRIVLEKALRMGMLSAVYCLGIWIALAITAALMSIDISLDRIAAALASVWLLGLVLGGVAMLVGALTGKRALSLGVGLGIAVAGFFVNALGPLADVLEPWQPLSPHYHYLGYDPLTHGLDLQHALILGIVAVILVGLAAALFERRDLRA
jgi:ABC-2 type transport system permease protein